MKILFIADIHIKLGQKNVPVDWAKNRYNLLERKLEQMQRDVDIIIFGGDTFDRTPTLEELEVYFSLISVLDKTTYIIPGNHESVKKNTTFLTSLKEVTYALNPLVNIIDDFHSIPGIDFIPYNRLKEYTPVDIDFHERILVTHVRGEIQPHVKAEIPLSLFERWEVVLAGDLHSYENSQLNILYPGSPMSTSFHRNSVTNGVIILDSDTLKHEWVDLGLPQLIRKTIKAGEPMPATTYDHTIYEVSGDMAELGSVENSALLDKKITVRETDVALLLDPDMSLTEELQEYLTYILQLKEESVAEVIKVFHTLEAQIHD